MNDVVHTHRGIKCTATLDIEADNRKWFYIIENGMGGVRFPNVSPYTFPTTRIFEMLVELGSLDSNCLWNNESLYDMYLHYCCESAD